LNVELLNKTPNMKKIFFIFTMLLMSVVSVWAEELSETITITTKNKYTYTGDHFTIEGTPNSNYGFVINGGYRISIIARNGEIITKVVYVINKGVTYASNVKTEKGDIDTDNKIITNVSETPFDIYSDVEGLKNYLTISKLIIYYEENTCFINSFCSSYGCSICRNYW